MNRAAAKHMSYAALKTSVLVTMPIRVEVCHMSYHSMFCNTAIHDTGVDMAPTRDEPVFHAKASLFGKANLIYEG